MTAWDLFAIAFQRWAVTLACALVTGLLVFSVLHAKPVYFEQVRVVLLPPVTPASNGFGSTSASLIDLAGVVAKSVQGSDPQALPVSDSVTLFDQGIRSGFSVVQPNLGGQWAYNFQDPVLNVEAVDSTPELTQQQLQKALDKIQASLMEIQDAQGVDATYRVRSSQNPSIPHVTVQKGSTVRAVGASALAGGLVAAAILVTLGRKRTAPPKGVRRRGSSRPVASRPAATAGNVHPSSRPG